MRRFVQCAAAVMLCITLGLHWAALQAVAWAGMLVERLPSQPLSVALETTFDGKHPCPVCLMVREGKASERRDPAAPETRTLKLEQWVRLESVPVVLSIDRPSPEFPPVRLGSLRFERPSFPPPRSA